MKKTRQAGSLPPPGQTAEDLRLMEDAKRIKHWKRWGPYLSERAWGTVREDYSPNGTAWEHFPHDHARSRAYRWNEDGLAGFCDRHQWICFALALWNGRGTPSYPKSPNSCQLSSRPTSDLYFLEDFLG